MTKKVRIEMERAGRGRIWIDGNEIDNVYTVKFEAGVDRATLLTIELSGVEIEVEGPADVKELAPPSIGAYE